LSSPGAKWWFSVLDMVGAINDEDDYSKTRNYWKYLKTKLKREKNELVSATSGNNSIRKVLFKGLSPKNRGQLYLSP